MKNADITDIKWLSTGVMYLIDHKWFGPFRGHIKQPMLDLDDGWIDPWLVETVEGSLLVVERSWIKPVPRKQGSPKKQRRVCKKGTKPNLGLGVPYDSALAVPGVKVVCRDGNIYDVIDRKDYTGINKQYTTDCFHKHNGHHIYNPMYDILRVIVEEDKPKQGHFNGYSVGDWHFWDGKSSVPPVGKDVVVEYWCRCETKKMGDTQPARNLSWDWSNKHTRGSDIIAFKIIP